MTLHLPKTAIYPTDRNWHEVGALGEPAYSGTWVAYAGGGYANAQFRMDSEGWVKLSGLAKSGTLGTAIFTLPEAYRPLKDFYFKALANNVQSWLKVGSNGIVSVSNPGGGGSSAYVNFDNAYFPSWKNWAEFEDKYFVINQAEGRWGTRTNDSEFQTGIWKRKSGMYQIMGIHGVTTGATAGVSLYPHMPRYTYQVGMTDSTSTLKVMSISTSRGISTVTTTTSYTMLDCEYSLFDIEDLWTAPTFVNSWVNFGNDATNRHVPAGYYKDQDGYVHLRGLLKSGSSTTATMFTLPEGYRPADRAIFSTVSGAGKCRVDVHASGVVGPINGGSVGWTSLSGICFYAGG